MKPEGDCFVIFIPGDWRPGFEIFDLALRLHDYVFGRESIIRFRKETHQRGLIIAVRFDRGRIRAAVDLSLRGCLNTAHVHKRSRSGCECYREWLLKNSVIGADLVRTGVGAAEFFFSFLGGEDQRRGWRAEEAISYPTTRLTAYGAEGILLYPQGPLQIGTAARGAACLESVRER